MNELTHRELYILMDMVGYRIKTEKSQKAKLVAIYAMMIARGEVEEDDIPGTGTVKDVHEDAILEADKAIGILSDIQSKLADMERRLEIEIMCARAGK